MFNQAAANTPSACALQRLFDDLAELPAHRKFQWVSKAPSVA